MVILGMRQRLLTRNQAFSFQINVLVKRYPGGMG